jgi:AraC-like DNA-binding protein
MSADPRRTTTVRRRSAGEDWEMVLGEPEARLREHVLGYMDFAEHTTHAVRRREIAGALVPLIINFGPPFRIHGSGGSAVSEPREGFVAGLSDGFSVSESTGRSRCVQVNFTPLGARRFLRLPMGELANRVVGLEDLFGRAAADRLAARLHDAPDAEARFALVDAFVGARVDEARGPSAGVGRAWRRLRETSGRVEAGALAAEIGCSRKHLAARFHDEVGLPPKSVARILRFQHAVSLLDPSADVRWTEVAHRCGYYDQAHLIRDFRQFAGATPGEYLRGIAIGNDPAAGDPDPTPVAGR